MTPRLGHRSSFFRRLRREVAAGQPRRAGRRRRSTAPFRVKEAKIRNIGTIDALDLDFENESVTAIYASNGLGKTTVLECLSLLGHLPCFPTYSAEERFCPSALDTGYPSLRSDSWGHYEAILPHAEVATNGVLNYLAANAPQPGARFGYVQFTVVDVVGRTNCVNTFVVLVHRPLLLLHGTPRLTEILSRDSFLSREIPEISDVADDRILSRCGLIAYDPDDQIGRTMGELILSIAKGRTFTINEDNERRLVSLHLDGIEAAVPRSVCYVNTDLNDFGRGNDLRESPKDLERDFRNEMIGRMGIELDPQGSFAHFDQLQRSCDLVLSTPLENFCDRRVIPPAFVLKNLTVRGEHVAIWIDRLDGQRHVSVNFLSAGENEVLFIYLMILNFTENPQKKSAIILLDEPDLHIANASRFRFFEEALELTDGKAQLVMSTHSPSAYEVIKAKYDAVPAKVKVLVRVLPDVSAKSTRLEAAFDAMYIERLRQISAATGLLGSAERFLSRTIAQISAIIPRPHNAAVTVIVTWLAFLFTLLILIAGAILNDVVGRDHWIRETLLRGANPMQYHAKTLEYWPAVASGVILPLIGFAVGRKLTRRDHAARLRKFRASAGATGS